MKERMRHMEERVKNVEGAIILLTDMLNRQDEILARLDKRGEEQQKLLASMAANQIVLGAKTNKLEEALEEFVRDTRNLFIQAGRQLRDHDGRIQKLEDNK